MTELDTAKLIGIVEQLRFSVEQLKWIAIIGFSLISAVGVHLAYTVNRLNLTLDRVVVFLDRLKTKLDVMLQRQDVLEIKVEKLRS